MGKIGIASSLALAAWSLLSPACSKQREQTKETPSTESAQAATPEAP